MSTKISFFLFIILSSFTSSTSSTDALTTSESLNFNQTLISAEQKYEAGFFTRGSGADPGRIYLGIWYYNLLDVRTSDGRTIVWVANRDNPATNSSSIVLKLRSNGGGEAVIADGGVVIWASNKSWSNSVVNPVLQLLDTGNLVIKEDNSVDDDEYIWQSFDYPTDSLLPSQKLGWTKKTGLDRRLISWKSTSDPASGNYSFALTRTGDPEMFVKDGTQKIYRTGPFTGKCLSGIPAMISYPGMNFSLPNTPDEVYYMFALTNPSIRSRISMGEDGLIYRYTWVPESRYWDKFWVQPELLCDKYMACGPYGVCDSSKLFDCVCPRGFIPRDSSAVNLRDGTHGCVRRTGLECGTDGFGVMRNMKLPMSGGATVRKDKVLKECEKMCKKDCNCTAYASAQVVDGVESGCVMWTGDLLDMRAFDEGGQDLYIRLAAADLISTANLTKKIIIGISIAVAAVTLIVAIASYLAWKAKHKPSATTDQSVSRLGTPHDLQWTGTTTPTSKGLSIHNNCANDLELPFYSFDAIRAFTNNFSDENKLGQGGFGCVFKGVVNGFQEIAVKRLSKESIQGFEEFKNEVKLIAKLQHRNLVRLLGYCVDREEKMLIYEYLRNRSLDFLLFNRERCSLLDWQRRFNIICGVAKGLLYLHHDSRLRIIHRDLKASNILLDDSMIPKISDFGMARIFRGDETEANNTRRVVGTYGYMSPEYAMDGVFSIKSDVFSFGVLLLEIVTGKQNRVFRNTHQHLNILGHSWNMWEEGKAKELLDPSIQEDSYQLYEVLKCIQIGLLCVQAQPNDRPTMSSVVLMLSSETASLPQPKLPGFFLEWRPKGEMNSNQGQQDETFTINQVTFTTLDPR